MPGESDPSRKNYGFKERPFQRDERPASESRPAISVEDLAKQSGPVTRAGPASGAPKASDPNDVYASLEKNRTAEKAAGADNIEIKKKVTSRRAKDYWLLLLAGNALIIGGALFIGGVALIFGAAGVILYSICLTWSMWQVMGRY